MTGYNPWGVGVSDPQDKYLKQFLSAKGNTVLPKMESCREDFGSKTSQWEKKRPFK